MTVKEKATAILEDYKMQLNALNDRFNETRRRLIDITLEIRFIEEKEIPEAV